MKPDVKFMQAVEVFSMCTRLIALTTIYSDESLEEAARWLDDEAKVCDDRFPKDAVYLRRLAEMLRDDR